MFYQNGPSILTRRTLLHCNTWQQYRKYIKVILGQLSQRCISVSNVQNLCWLMIIGNYHIHLFNILGFMGLCIYIYIFNPIGKSYKPSSEFWILPKWTMAMGHGYGPGRAFLQFLLHQQQVHFIGPWNHQPDRAVPLWSSVTLFFWSMSKWVNYRSSSWE